MDRLSLPGWDLGSVAGSSSLSGGSVAGSSSRRSSRCSTVSSTRTGRSRAAFLRPYKVLILASTLSQAEEIHQLLSSADHADLEFRYPTTLKATPTDPDTLLADCCDVIRDEDIDAVVSAHAGLEFVHAVLAKLFPGKIKGPSFESAFVALHRHYGAEIVTVGFGVRSRTVIVGESDDARRVSAILEDDISVPALVREAFGFEDAFSKKIRSGKVLETEKEWIRLILEERLQSLRRLLDANLDAGRYPVAKQLCYTLEEYAKPGKLSGSLHLVEACVVDGALVPWCVSDVGLYKQRPVVVRHVTCPSRLDDSAKYNLWAVYREVAQRLLDLGFDNQFLQMEMLIARDERVKVVNLKSCLSRGNVALYRHVLLSGDSLLGQINTGLGRTPREPRPIPQRCAVRGRLSSQVYNVTLRDILDLKESRTHDCLTLVTSRPDHVIMAEHADEDGVHIGDVMITGTSPSECHQVMKEVCLKAVREWKPSKPS